MHSGMNKSKKRGRRGGDFFLPSAKSVLGILVGFSIPKTLEIVSMSMPIMDLLASQGN